MTMSSVAAKPKSSTESSIHQPEMRGIESGSNDLVLTTPLLDSVSFVYSNS